MDSTIDAALNYVIFITRHVRRGDPTAAILAILIELGFQAHSDGFGYLRESILWKTNHRNMRLSSIYQEVIKSYDSAIGYNQVDQAIRSAIKNAWSNGDPDKWGLFFPERLVGSAQKPSNHQFISYLACILELWMGMCEKVSCEI